MKKIIILLLIYLSTFSHSNALIKVDITRGNLDPLPIAVSPLHVDGASEKLDNIDNWNGVGTYSHRHGGRLDDLRAWGADVRT